MRVAITYGEGGYSMYDSALRTMADGKDRQAWLDANTVEIDDAVWALYLLHERSESMWQEIIRDYDNKLFEAREARKP